MSARNSGRPWHSALSLYHTANVCVTDTVIKDSVRGRVWQLLAGSLTMAKPGAYDELKSRPPLPIYEIIERDINRCYPDHSL